MAKNEKHALIFDWEEEADEIEIIGICSHVPSYRLVWDINRVLNFQLKSSIDLLTVYPKKNKELSFSYYYDYGKEEDHMEIYLVKNKENAQLLMPELAQIDYLLFFVNNQVHNVEEINKKIKSKCVTVSLANLFDAENYESTKNIIFEKNEKN